MTISELIAPEHLNRQALIYVRQSSPHQTLTNQESLRLQYALRQRAAECGWPEQAVHVIDADLGQTGSSAEGRRGFQDLIARVTLGQVGIIFSYDVTRLSRNCSDWYQLLDLCGFRRCLIGDRDGIYDPSSINGRLLLGLKGQISELELHTIKARLTAGLFNKARRGELALILPVGLVRDELGRVMKHPDREVQARIELVFASFLQLRSLAKVMRHFKVENLPLPRRDRFGDVAWRRATVSSVGAILRNPAYAGAFVYGRTRSARSSPGRPAVQKPLPIDQWRVLIRDRYPAYIDWDTFERIAAMIRDNHSEYQRNQTRGMPRRGQALLHGMTCCGECGHKMVVQYKGRPTYICNHIRQQHGEPVCQRLPAGPIDDWVIGRFFDALAPAELDLYERIRKECRRADDDVRKAREQQLERLRYHASLAERQFQKTDPDNRLVAAELEKRWEAALRELRAAEDESNEQARGDGAALAALAALPPDPLDEATRQALIAAGTSLPQWWRAGRFTREQQKALLRCLIDKVVLHRLAADRVRCRIVWRGGETTTSDIAVSTGALCRMTGFADMKQRILAAAHSGQSDDQIAADLTHDGFRSPRHDTVLPSTVKTIRLRHRILVEKRQSHPRRIRGKWTVPQLAARLTVERHWLYDRIHNGTIAIIRDAKTKLYLFPAKPETLRVLRRLRRGLLNSVRF
jgi:DNA invertase Pin-like site-specific DNA recombinase